MGVKRRRFIRVTSYLLAICLVFAVAGFFTQKAKGSYESTLEKVRFEGLNSLCEYTLELSGGLRLLAVSADASVVDSASYVCSRAIGAIGCTACFDSAKIANISAFLDSVYNFAEGFTQTQANRDAAIMLSDYAEEMYYHLSDLSNAVTNGIYSLSEYGNVYQRKSIPYFEDYLDFENGSESEIVSFTAVSPTASKSAFLSKKSEITEEEAKEKAEKTANISAVLWRGEGAETENGIEVYRLSHGDTAIEICKPGGIIRRLINPKPCGEKVYGMNEALEKAKAFLKQEGYNDMQFFCGKEGSFSAVLYFAPEVNGVLLLNSLAKIEICLASGEITFFDASEYIGNYRTDVYSTGDNPDLSSLIPENLSLNKTLLSLADINERERLCYLAICSLENENVLIFIDSSSFKILKTQFTDFSLLI